jgi:flagellar protein FlaJ
MNDLESEKRSSLRPYIFITYFSAIMIVVTTFIMVYFINVPVIPNLSASVPRPASAQSLSTVDTLLTIAVFESYVIGIVAGKMGEGSTADGFKHALILVVISVAAVFVTQQLFGLRLQ